MKIQDLIPSELQDIVIRTISGCLTEEDRSYLREKCKIEVPNLWFCDHGGVELEIKELNDSEVEIYPLEPNEICDADNYLEAAYYTTLCHAIAQLPSWVFDNDKFEFNTRNTSFEQLSLDELEHAFDTAWNYVFDRGSREAWPKHCPGSVAMLRVMTEGPISVPSWAVDGNQSREGLSISVSLLKELEAMYIDHSEEDASAESSTYVSPFTGKEH